jgi:hypothetical protein
LKVCDQPNALPCIPVLVHGLVRVRVRVRVRVEYVYEYEYEYGKKGVGPTRRLTTDQPTELAGASSIGRTLGYGVFAL